MDTGPNRLRVYGARLVAAAGVAAATIGLATGMTRSMRGSAEAGVAVRAVADAAAPLTSTVVASAAYLPVGLRDGFPERPLYPNPRLAERIWRAAERLGEVWPVESLYPGYEPGKGGPSPATVQANLEAACHDFPDLPVVFGPPGHHRDACHGWVATFFGTYHSVRLRRSGGAEDAAWAGFYLDAALDGAERFAYGPEDSPGAGYRDTLSGMWQNPLRAVDIAIISDVLRQAGALDGARRARVQEMLSAIARAWKAEIYDTGVHPSSDVELTVRTAPTTTATSLAGRQVVSSRPWTFVWRADKGNTPAEEAAWMGAGAVLASRVLAARLPVTETAALYDAGSHYIAFALAYDRTDPVHGGLVRTLNRETEGGYYGQRAFWVENHAPDTPSIPYLGATWHFVDTALFGSSLGQQAPWTELVPDDGQWQVLLRSAGETLRAPDGTFLVDLTPGGGIGFALDRFPEWAAPCGGDPGKDYVRYDGRMGGPPLYVSELGHPAGTDFIAMSWPIMRMAASRRDRGSYEVWEERLDRVLDEYTARPPDPHWPVCKTAVYVSANPAYHWARILGNYMIAYLGASGYEMPAWTE